MWHCVVFLAALHHAESYAKAWFIMPLQTSQQYCRQFAQDFIKSEQMAQPPHTATYSCKVVK